MATNAGELFIDIKVNQAQIQKQLAGVNRSVSRLATNVNRSITTSFGRLPAAISKIGDRMSKSMGRAFTTIGRHARRAALIIGVALAAVTVSSIKAAASARETENLFTVSMDKMARSAERWAKSYSQSLGLFNLDTKKFLATMNVVIKSQGFAADKSFEMAKGLTQLTFDMSSFFNLQPEVAFEKIMSGMAGMVRPLRSLGFSLSETNTKTFALKTGILGLNDEWNETAKITARYALLMKLTSFLHGDLAKTMMEPENRFRSLQNRIKELRIELGNKLLPLWSKFLEFALKLVDIIRGPLSKWLEKITKQFDKFISDPQKMKTFKDGLVSVKDTIIGIAAALKPIIVFFAKNPTLIAALIGAKIGGTLGGVPGALIGAGIGEAAGGDIQQKIIGKGRGTVLAQGVGLGAAAVGSIIAGVKIGTLLKTGAAVGTAGAAGTIGAVPSITGFGAGAGAVATAGAGIGAGMTIAAVAAAVLAIYGISTLVVPGFAELQGKALGESKLGKRLFGGGDFSTVEGKLSEAIKGKERRKQIRIASDEAHKAFLTNLAKRKQALKDVVVKRIQDEENRRMAMIKREDELRKKLISDRITLTEQSSNLLGAMSETGNRALTSVSFRGRERTFQRAGFGGAIRSSLEDKKFDEMNNTLKRIEYELKTNTQKTNILQNTYR